MRHFLAISDFQCENKYQCNWYNDFPHNHDIDLGYMNTQTHIIMGAWLTGKKVPKLAWAGALGGILPDLPMYFIIAALKLSGHSLSDIFDKFYWQPWWQIANGFGHSFLLWGALCLVSSILYVRNAKFSTILDKASRTTWVFALSISALIHSMIDFLCHRDDAHMHLWPLTEWRFRSPISYWDIIHYGFWFTLFEAALGLLIAIALFRRYQNKLLRAALGILVLLYIAVPAFFIYNL